MKVIVLVTVLFAGVMAGAEILGSNLELHQQHAIVDAIQISCGPGSKLSVLSHIEEIVQIDSGIRDVFFTTTLEGLILTSENTLDHQLILVKSVLTDSFDHQKKVWGVFSVQSVNCISFNEVEKSPSRN